MLSTTYYVSPTGSDTNAGTSPSAPWQTVAKVNAATFLPGDSILFQYGAQFHASLTASSSGTVADPITYGAYGDSTLANPLFVGSDVVANSAFTLVSGTTYSMSDATAINWVYDNDTFMRESTDALAVAGSSMSSDPATNIAYVEANTNFFYYDTTTTTLYLNTTNAFESQVISLGTRQDAVFSNEQNNLIFTNLDVTETAQDNAGYGVRIENSSNVQVLNSTASLTGKHAFGVIDSTGFVGQNLTANQCEPDLGFGGASGFVSYSDNSQTGNTSQWIDCTFNDPNSAYPAFITHGDVGAIASILLKNIVSMNGYGSGLDCQSTGPSEVITIEGGEFGGGRIELDTDNSTISGVTFYQGLSGIEDTGSNDVIQNCVFNNLDANIDAGNDGGFVDAGTNNTVRFNTFLMPTGPALYLQNDNTNTDIYGNIFDCEYAIGLNFTDTGMLTSGYNVFSPNPSFILGGTTATAFASLSQWQGLGYDTTSVTGDPGFVDAATGNFQLTASSPAIDLYKGTPDSSVVGITTDFAGNPRPIGAGYDAGAYEADIPVTGSVSVADTSLAAPLPGTTVPALFTLTLSATQTTAVSIAYHTTDGTAIAGTDYTATSGTVTFPAGTITETVSVPVTPTLAADSSKTFQLLISSSSAAITVGTAAGTATVSNANQTTVTFNKKTAATYTDAAGKKVTLKIGGVGSGTALFVAGNADPVQIELTTTTVASTFSATTIGGVTTLEDIVIQGPIGSVTTTANLMGSLEITGTVTHLTLGNLDAGASILLDSAASKPLLKFGAATSATLTSAAPITSLTATSWAGPITAPSIAALSIKGALSGTLNLSSSAIALASAKLGSLTAGTWTVAGSVGTIAVTGAVTDSSLKSGGSMAKVTIGAAMDSTFFAGVASTVAGLPTATSDFASSSEIGSFTVTAPRTIPNAFSDSFVAAAKILTAKVQRVQTANSGTPFGFATESLGSFTDIEIGKKTFTWTSKKATSLLTFAGDFKVSIL